MSRIIFYNYMAVIGEGGEVAGIFAMEKGCENEKAIVSGAIEHGLKIRKSTKEEFENFNDGEEPLVISE